MLAAWLTTRCHWHALLDLQVQHLLQKQPAILVSWLQQCGVQVQELWPRVVGALLTETAGISRAALATMPHAHLLAYLAPATLHPPPVDAGLPVAPPEPDARVLQPHAHMYSLLYKAQCALLPPSDRDACRRPQALLGAGGRGLVEQDSEKLLWWLLYSPRDAAAWKAVSAFYQDTADALLCDAAAEVTATVRSRPVLRRRSQPEPANTQLRSWGPSCAVCRSGRANSTHRRGLCSR